MTRGTRYLYGSSDSGRQYDTSTGTSTNTYKWYLQEVRDTNGNYIKYTYTRDSNEIYPNQIIYTGNGVDRRPRDRQFHDRDAPRRAHQLRARLQGNHQLSHLRNRRVVQRPSRPQIPAWLRRGQQRIPLPPHQPARARL